jgi:hypothetical protein
VIAEAVDVVITVPASVAEVAGVEEEVIRHSPESIPNIEALPVDPVALPREGKISINTL